VETKQGLAALKKAETSLDMILIEKLMKKISPFAACFTPFP
jgi:hypothetical protein